MSLTPPARCRRPRQCSRSSCSRTSTAHLRIDSTFEDALIAGYRLPRCRNLEGRDGWLGRAFLTQTWDWTFDCFPQGQYALYVPLPPLQSVTSITVRGSDGVATVWSPASYQIDNKE